MTSMYPNEHYNRFGEYVEPKASELCKCECHIPGRNIMQCVPCCTIEVDEATHKFWASIV